jgi:hypothetical protein
VGMRHTGLAHMCRTWAGYAGDIGLPRMGHLATQRCLNSRVRNGTIATGGGTRSPVDEVGKESAHRQVSRASGHEVAVRQIFPTLVAVVRITTVVIEDHHWRQREPAEAERRSRIPLPSN